MTDSGGLDGGTERPPGPRTSGAGHAGRLPPDVRYGKLPGRSTVVETDDGTKLAVDEVGSGAPVVLTHGIAVTRDFWQHTRVHLAERGHRVVTFDQRGHGRSDVGADGFSLAALSGDLATVIETLDLDDVIVAGHSMGGIGTQVMLLDASPSMLSRLRHVVLCSTTPCNDRSWRLFSAIPGVDGGVSISAPLDAAEPMVSSVLFGNSAPQPARFIDDALSLAAQNDLRQLSLAGLALSEFDLRDRLKDVRVPTRVVCGSLDKVTPPRLNQIIADRVGNSDFVLCDGAGHYLPWERITEIVDSILDPVPRDD